VSLVAAAPIGTLGEIPVAQPGRAQRSTTSDVTTQRAARKRAVRDRRAPKVELRATQDVLTVRCDEVCTVVVTVGKKRITKKLRADATGHVRIAVGAGAIKVAVVDSAGNRRSITRSFRAVTSPSARAQAAKR
jgi:hypothetical protein